MKQNNKCQFKDALDFQTTTTQLLSTEVHPLIIDGLNVLYSGGQGRNEQVLLDLLTVLACIPQPKYIVLPIYSLKKYITKSKYEHFSDVYFIDTPANTDDDWFILGLAQDKQGFIISNDGYQNFKDFFPESLFVSIIKFLTVPSKDQFSILIPLVCFYKKNNHK